MRINPEYQRLIGPLSIDERAKLKASIIKFRRCYDSIKTWNGDIVDGHHRYEITQELAAVGLTIGITEEPLEFATATDAKIWMITEQIGRRNLDKSEIGIRYAPKLMGLEKEKARQRMEAGVEIIPSGDSAGGSAKGEAREIVAKSLGIGQKIVDQVMEIVTNAPDLIPLVESKDLTVNAAYKISQIEDPEKREVVIFEATTPEGKEIVNKRRKEANKAKKEAPEQARIEHSNEQLRELNAKQKAMQAGEPIEEEEPQPEEDKPVACTISNKGQRTNEVQFEEQVDHYRNILNKYMVTENGLGPHDIYAIKKAMEEFINEEAAKINDCLGCNHIENPVVGYEPMRDHFADMNETVGDSF